MKHLLHSAALLLALLLPGQLPAQTLDPTFHIPEIYREATIAEAAQQPDGQYVVYGTFTRANRQAVNKLTRLTASGAVDPVFEQNLRNAVVVVEKLLPMPNGQLLVQGDYQAGAVQRRYLFRLNADGTLDASFNVVFAGSDPYRDVAQTVLQPDGRVLILGYRIVNMNNSAEIFRLLNDGSPDPSFSVSLGTAPSSNNQMLLQTDGKIVLLGSLTFVNGTSARYLARLNADGSTDTSYQPAILAPMRISSLRDATLDANNSLLIAGTISTDVPGQERPLIRLLSTGALDPGLTLAASLLTRHVAQVAVQPNGRITVLCDNYYASVPNGTIVVYPFSQQLQRLLPSGAPDTSFQPGSADGSLTSIRSLPNGGVLTWGYINNVAGQRRTLAVLQPDGSLNTSFGPLLQQPGRVHKLLRQADGRLVLAGDFNSIDGHLTDRLAQLLPNGQPDPGFAWRQPNSASWNLTALALQANGQVVLAGHTLISNVFTGTERNYRPLFGRLHPDGTPDASFAPAITLSQSVPNGIRLLASPATGQVLVGGEFVDAAGRANLTRLTATGAIDRTFTPPASQPAIQQGFVQTDGSIVNMVPGVPISQLIQRLRPDGTPDPTLVYTPSAPASSIGLGRVFALPTTGSYAISGVFGTSRVLDRLTATGAPVPGFGSAFQPVPSLQWPVSGVNVVAEQADGKLLVGGYMQQVTGFSSPLIPLARLNADGQLDNSFSTTIIPNSTQPYAFGSVTGLGSGNEVEALVVQPDGAIVAGGYFLEAGGQAATGLVRLLPAGVLATETPRPGSPAVQVWPVPAHDVLHLALRLADQPRRVALLDALGRKVIAQEVTQPDLTLDTAELAPGLYVVRVEYASGPVMRRVVLE